MSIRASRGLKQAISTPKRRSANFGVYKLTGAILIGGVRWHQTSPGWWAAGWSSRAGWFDSCLVAFCRVVGSRVVELSWLVRFLPRGLLPKSGVSFEHFSCLVLGWSIAEKWDGFEHFSCLVLGWPTVNCFVARAVHHW